MIVKVHGKGVDFYDASSVESLDDSLEITTRNGIGREITSKDKAEVSILNHKGDAIFTYWWDSEGRFHK